jgi:hypothetical protein
VIVDTCVPVPGDVFTQCSLFLIPGTYTLRGVPVSGAAVIWDICPGVVQGNDCTVTMNSDRVASVVFGGPVGP